MEVQLVPGFLLFSSEYFLKSQKESGLDNVDVFEAHELCSMPGCVLNSFLLCVQMSFGDS